MAPPNESEVFVLLSTSHLIIFAQTFTVATVHHLASSHVYAAASESLLFTKGVKCHTVS